jgi:poly(3-hydroxybutyrate) depolymerase
VRHFKVYVPPTYDPRVPTPVVYMLGGFTVDAYGLAAYTELMRIADLNGLIVAFPQQHYYYFGPEIGWVFAWNVFPTDWAGGDWQVNPDVDFIRELTSSLSRLYNVDRTRVFSSGHSRGAAMSIILAFELPDVIAGFWSEMGFVEANGYTARMRERSTTLARRPPGVLVHGYGDPDVPFRESELIAETLESLGWASGEDYLFFDLDYVAHEWQPQYNQPIWDFLSARGLPGEL